MSLSGSFVIYVFVVVTICLAHCQQPEVDSAEKDDRQYTDRKPRLFPFLFNVSALLNPTGTGTGTMTSSVLATNTVALIVAGTVLISLLVLGLLLVGSTDLDDIFSFRSGRRFSDEPRNNLNYRNIIGKMTSNRFLDRFAEETKN
ncbi:Uncharacterised protein g5504 [Pycnogonum litorale]